MHNRHEHILVCVTGQRNCERLIRHSAQLAQTLARENRVPRVAVDVIHVAGGKNRFMGNEDEGAALEYLFQISKNYSAEMTVMRSENVADTIVAFAHRQNVTRVVLGVSLYPAQADAPDIIAELKGKLAGVEFHVIPGETPLAT